MSRGLVKSIATNNLWVEMDDECQMAADWL